MIYQVGNAATTHAVKLALVALVLMLQPLQSVFVFLIGIFLTIVVPKLYSEKIGFVDLIQKAAAIAITSYGVYLLEVIG